MKSQLFIPKKVKVGFQKRDDTYTKRLSFIVAIDDSGKIRKEKSWEGWRDKKIAPEEVDNIPHSGFVLNKDVKRTGEWFGSGRNMIRIYDDRGFEFEITTGNLLFILMTTNCHKRGLEGEFVYAWQGTELILLPVDCEEYRNSVQYTELQRTSISAKYLVPGCSYKTKKQQDVIYLGRFNWLRKKWTRNKHVLASDKKHVFIDANNNLFAFDPAAHLALQNTDVPVSNYAELVDIFTKSPRATKAVKLETKPTDNEKEFYTEKSPGQYLEWRRYDWSHQTEWESNYTVIVDDSGLIETQYTYAWERKKSIPPNRLTLYVVLESGSRVPFKKYRDTID